MGIAVALLLLAGIGALAAASSAKAGTQSRVSQEHEERAKQAARRAVEREREARRFRERALEAERRGLREAQRELKRRSEAEGRKARDEANEARREAERAQRVQRERADRPEPMQVAPDYVARAMRHLRENKPAIFRRLAPIVKSIRDRLNASDWRNLNSEFEKVRVEKNTPMREMVTEFFSLIFEVRESNSERAIRKMERVLERIKPMGLPTARRIYLREIANARRRRGETNEARQAETEESQEPSHDETVEPPAREEPAREDAERERRVKEGKTKLQRELNRVDETTRNVVRRTLEMGEYPGQERLQMIRDAAERLRDEGFSAIPAALREKARQLENKAPQEPSHDETVETPEGFAPRKAAQLAQAVNQNVTKREYNYDRRLVKKFQQAAGLKQDGIYGPKTRGAIVFYGVRNARKALFDPRKAKVIPYPKPLARLARERLDNAA